MREREDNKTKRQRMLKYLTQNFTQGGLRHKEKPKTQKFPWVSKKHLEKEEKKQKKPRRARTFPTHFYNGLLLFICPQCVCVWLCGHVYVCTIVPSTGIRDAED